ncbi:hypothetical protein GEMRC1_013436 [Eukaryota sp. GEM-RC1]
MEKASSTIPSPSSLSATSLRYAKELCKAVKFLHSKSIVHGDLKPGNVLIVNDRIRIADFGTSRNIESTSTVPRTGSMTVRYAAPEQFDNKISPQSDIYSLGIVLYELFQNMQAFIGKNQYAIMGAKYGGKSLPFDEPLPSSLSNVINQCIQSDPILRPKISEILRILETVSAPLFVMVDDFQKAQIQLSQRYSEIFRMDPQVLGPEVFEKLAYLGKINKEINYFGLRSLMKSYMANKAQWTSGFFKNLLYKFDVSNLRKSTLNEIIFGPLDKELPEVAKDFLYDHMRYLVCDG